MKFLNYLILNRTSLRFSGCDILGFINIYGPDSHLGFLVTDELLRSKLLSYSDKYIQAFYRDFSCIGTKDFVSALDLISMAQKADIIQNRGKIINKPIRNLKHEMGLRKYHSLKFKK